MSYVYLLAGENLELAEAELTGFLRSQGVEEEPDRRASLGETEAEPDRLRRLALVHEVSELVQRGELGSFDTDYRPEGGYAVRAIDIEGNHDKPGIQEELGETLGAEDNHVDLDNPDEEICVYLLEDEYVLGKLVLDIDRNLFEKRKNQNRPFSSPISLDPVMARVMVNLSEVPAEGHVIDPFCGTGGILIEAGLCGIGVHGLDISSEMVEGTRENLERYGIIVHDVRRGDISEATELLDRKFDAVITDLPYGKASKVEEEPVKRFLNTYNKLTGGKTVFMYNKPKLNGLDHEFELYIHKNLTRYLYVLD